MFQEIEIKNINHLGIIAGIIDELKIVELINQELGIEEQEIVNSGEIVKAIILNGLGAELNLKLIEAKLKFHVIDEIQINQNLDKTYQITGVILTNNDVIEAYKNRAGNFIITTNRLDSESFSCDEMLLKYKEQQNVERGFARLKAPLFFA